MEKRLLSSFLHSHLSHDVVDSIVVLNWIVMLPILIVVGLLGKLL